MADLSADLREHLLTRHELRDLVADRVYPDTLPQDVELPAIVLEIETDRAERLTSGPSVLRQARFTCTVCAYTRRDANAIADQIDQATILGGYRGVMGQADTTYVRDCRRTNHIASTVAPVQGSDRWEHRATLFYVAEYSQP